MYILAQARLSLSTLDQKGQGFNQSCLELIYSFVFFNNKVQFFVQKVKT